MDVTDIMGYWIGMRKWRTASQVYHLLNREYSDDLNKMDVTWSEENIVRDALLHFNEYVDETIRPAKSYFVAICYAYWLSQDFDENFFELLNDKYLLAENDPHFIQYHLDIDTYDQILKNIEFPLKMKGMVPDVRKYYEDEFKLALETL